MGIAAGAARRSLSRFDLRVARSKIRPLVEHLGEYRWYLDLNLALSPSGMEVIGEPHRWHIEADWKSGSDNFAGDSYHTQTLHQSIVRLGLSDAAGASGGKNDIHVTECSGHSTSIRRKDPGETYFWGYPEEVYREFRSGSELSEEQFDLVQRAVVYTGTIFPNLSLIHIFAKDAPDNEGAAFFSLRQWKPRGPGKMEAWSWVLVPRSAPAEYKERAYRAAVASFSPSGNFEQDDSIAWAGVSRAARGQFAKQQNIMLNYQMGLEGMSEAKSSPTGPGPASSTIRISKKACSERFGVTGVAPCRLEPVGEDRCRTTILFAYPDQFCAEQFLFQEAELLDDFKLLDWLLLLDRAIDYRIPVRCTRPQDELDKAFSATAFHMIEHFGSLEARMKRFGAGGWSEFPPSRTRRNVSNIRVDRSAADRLSVKSNLLYYWARDEQNVIVSAERHDELRENDGTLKLARRVVLVDHTTLPLPNLSVFFGVPDYCVAPTQTTTSGPLSVLAATPHEALRSPRKVAALRLGPQ